jgi:hypothetical protein
MTYFVTEVRVADWEAARSVAQVLRGFVFRGQEDAAWPLTPSLERAAERYGLGTTRTRFVVLQMLHEFQQRARLLLPAVPDASDVTAWLALLQHHGAPTPLLDLTRSFYVAAFFAVERARDDAAVWALNADFMAGKYLERIDPRINHPFRPPIDDAGFRSAFERSLLKGEFLDLVVPLVPSEMTERVAIQQGLFVASISEKLPFAEALARTFSVAPELIQETRVMEFRGSEDEASLFTASRESALTKVVIDRLAHKDALDDLRSMNVTAATLFPGLDGYARSLDYWVRSDQLAAVEERVIQRLVDQVVDTKKSNEKVTR